MGAAMPRGVVVRDLVGRIQPLTVALLLPLFFTYSGLNTKIGLLNTGFLWLMCGAVLVAAVLGKGVACWLAARATGIPNREALGIGTLMNARGLMELIIINIGLQRGVISEGLFATLVIMAVITTLMASPVFERLVGTAAIILFPSPTPNLPSHSEQLPQFKRIDCSRAISVQKRMSHGTISRLFGPTARSLKRDAFLIGT